MHPSNRLLSEIVAFRTYAKHLSHLARRESLEESINRDMIMHLERFPKLSKDIVKAFQKVHEFKAMPSMRSLQFAGDAILKNHVRQYNCAFLFMDDIRSFGEAFYLLLAGTGVGYSVQKYHTDRLPSLRKPKREGKFIAHDSIEGWAQCIDMLMEAYFLGRIRPQFDFGNISPKGTLLITTGAKAPGSEPLKKMLELVEEKLKQAIGRKLRPIEIHDINCIISDAVLAGGIRRAALIALFDRDDKEMLNSKIGEWWLHSPWRARANNSIVLPRYKVTKEEFDNLYKICQISGSGEPGFFWTNDEYAMGANPCLEVSLLPNQFCNLSTINQTDIKDEKDFMNRVYAATLIGTLQASYTDFPYIREIWKQTTEKEALIGVSFTGVADSGSFVNEEMLAKAAKLVLEVNEKYAKKIGINPAARCTVVKPEGSSSCVLASASGIHARHSPYYLRRLRMNNNESLAVYLKGVIPELVEDDLFSSNGIVVTIPQESPKGALLRGEETAKQLFQRAMTYNRIWIAGGHRAGVNHNNVSVTISVKDEEWEEIRELMWENRNSYTGISLLPYDGGSYKQAPFEECTKETFESYSNLVKEIDLKQVREEQDMTQRVEILACSGGVCEIN